MSNIDFNQVFLITKEIFDKHLPNVQIIFQNDPHNDPSIMAVNYGVTLDPAPVERKSIKGTTTVDGYSISEWHSMDQTFYEPEDVSQNEIAQFVNHMDAIRRFAEVVFGKMISDLESCEKNVI